MDRGTHATLYRTNVPRSVSDHSHARPPVTMKQGLLPPWVGFGKFLLDGRVLERVSASSPPRQRGAASKPCVLAGHYH